MRYRGSMDGTIDLLSGAEAAAAVELLREAAFGYLAMAEPTGPYLLPLNFAYVEDERSGHNGPKGRIYFHTGEGRKTAALAADPRVCLAITAGVTFEQGDSPCIWLSQLQNAAQPHQDTVTMGCIAIE